MPQGRAVSGRLLTNRGESGVTHMGTLWVPGAERITPSSSGGTPNSTEAARPPRVVWHTTEAPSGDPKMFQAMINVLKSKGAEPQLLWDPLTDRLGQFFPLDHTGRALKNDGSYRTNRTGRVCIQIEVIGYSKTPFTGYWKPGQNFKALMAAIRSWGIPDAFPMGNPPKYPGASTRDRSIWLSKAGHYCHANVPGNDHGDPGAISPSVLFAAAPKTTTKPTTGGTAMAIQDTPEYKAAYQALVDYNHNLFGEGGSMGEFIQRMDAFRTDATERLQRIEDDTDNLPKA